MSTRSEIVAQLIELSKTLGDPARDLAILGEGNTSAKLSDQSFLVKASGKELRTADEGTFVEVSFAHALAALGGSNLSDAEVRQALVDARIGDVGATMPSVETFLHAYLLTLPGIAFVGHTHPVAVNSILCSVHSRSLVAGRTFPDEIVCCGPAVCYVEYTDPGLPLACALRDQVESFITEYNMAPKVILMENHGLITLGKRPKDVMTATLMYVKAAKILLGACAFGGVRFLTQQNVDRIHTRPDEHYRQAQIGS